MKDFLGAELASHPFGGLQMPRKLEPGNGQNYEKEGKLCEAYGPYHPAYMLFACIAGEWRRSVQ